MDMKRLLLATMLLASGILRAQSADESAGDAPDRGVARISMINGNVSVRHGDSGELAAAAMGTAHARNNAEAAGMIAALSDFKVGKVPRCEPKAWRGVVRNVIRSEVHFHGRGDGGKGRLPSSPFKNVLIAA